MRICFTAPDKKVIGVCASHCGERYPAAVLHIGAGLVHQGILAAVAGEGVVVQIAVLQAQGFPALDTLHVALPFLGGLALFLGLPLTLADTTGTEADRFSSCRHFPHPPQLPQLWQVWASGSGPVGASAGSGRKRARGRRIFRWTVMGKIICFIQ